MKEIKFRAEDFEGKVYYGRAVIGYNNKQGKHRFLIVDDNRRVKIKPASIAQFIGYDKAGNEVYEKATVKLTKGNDDVIQERRNCLVSKITIDGKKLDIYESF